MTTLHDRNTGHTNARILNTQNYINELYYSTFQHEPQNKNGYLTWITTGHNTTNCASHKWANAFDLFLRNTTAFFIPITNIKMSLFIICLVLKLIRPFVFLFELCYIFHLRTFYSLLCRMIFTHCCWPLIVVHFCFNWWPVESCLIGIHTIFFSCVYLV